MNETQKAAVLQKRQYEIEQGIYTGNAGNEEGDREYEDYEDDGEQQQQQTTTEIVNNQTSNLVNSSSSSKNSNNGLIFPDSPAFAALSPIEKAQMMAKIIAAKNTTSTVQSSSSSNITASGRLFIHIHVLHIIKYYFYKVLL